jgi:hypothetical protein
VAQVAAAMAATLQTNQAQLHRVKTAQMVSEEAVVVLDSAVLTAVIPMMVGVVVVA